MTVLIRSLAGDVLKVDLPSGATMSPWTSIGVINRRGNIHELTSGVREAGRIRALTTLRTIMDEQYSLRGGTLYLGKAQQYTSDYTPSGHLNVGVWEGSQWSLLAGAFHSSNAYVAALFAFLAPEETDEGLRVSSDVTWDEYPEVVFDVDHAALFQVGPSTKSALRLQLPDWPGTRVRGREIYSSNNAPLEGRPPDQYLMVRGDNHISRVIQLDGTLEKALEFAARCDCRYVA